MNEPLMNNGLGYPRRWDTAPWALVIARVIDTVTVQQVIRAIMGRGV